MNSASLVRFPKGNKRKERRAGGLSPPRQLQIEQTGAGSTTACTSPRTRWRSLRVSAVLSACLCSARPRVCLRGVCCERDSPAPVCRASACLSGQDSSRVLRPLRPPGRPRAGAVTHSAQHAGHTRFTRNFDFGLEVRGERGRRVCRTSCVCVCGLMLSSVYFAYFAYCACGCARAGSRTARYVCLLTY